MTTPADHVEATARLLLGAAREAGVFVTGDGRVLEDVAAQLLGVTPKTLANRRSEGTAPRHYNLGRISYRLQDLAAWIEAARVG